MNMNAMKISLSSMLFSLSAPTRTATVTAIAPLMKCHAKASSGPARRRLPSSTQNSVYQKKTKGRKPTSPRVARICR